MKIKLLWKKFKTGIGNIILFDSFAMFYYINGRLPYMVGYLFILDAETPPRRKSKPQSALCKIF